MENPFDGIVLIDKNEGETSFDVVKKIRRILKVKKVGHAGTLDPFATGLLVVLIGQGTKLSPYLMSSDKIYRATMRLGIETDTQDLTGRVIEKRPVPDLDLDQIRGTAVDFVGEIEQVPPLFSALKFKGKRAYEFARKGIHIELKKRKVKVFSLEILSVDLPDVALEVSCSSGTYIRSLATSLGEKLNSGAHLKSLRRLSSGPYKVEDALNLKRLGLGPPDRLIKDRIIPLRDAASHIQEAEVDGRTAGRMKRGCQPAWGEICKGFPARDFDEGYIKFVHGRELVAIGEINRMPGGGKGGLKLVRVFH